jgi:hypothetical protein
MYGGTNQVGAAKLKAQSPLPWLDGHMHIRPGKTWYLPKMPCSRSRGHCCINGSFHDALERRTAELHAQSHRRTLGARVRVKPKLDRFMEKLAALAETAACAAWEFVCRQPHR